jgi:hypothetical protein
MDEKEVLLATLNSTVSRVSKMAQSYELELANLTAEVIRLQMTIKSLSEGAESITSKKPEGK